MGDNAIPGRRIKVREKSGCIFIFVFLRRNEEDGGGDGRKRRSKRNCKQIAYFIWAPCCRFAGS